MAFRTVFLSIWLPYNVWSGWSRLPSGNSLFFSPGISAPPFLIISFPSPPSFSVLKTLTSSQFSVLGLCLISWLPQWVADTAGHSCNNYSFSFLFREGDLSPEPGGESWLVQEATVNNSSLPVICLRVDMWHSSGQWGTNRSLGGRDFRRQLYKQTLVPLNKMWEYGIWSPGIYLVSLGRRPTGSIITCCPGALI